MSEWVNEWIGKVNKCEWMRKVSERMTDSEWTNEYEWVNVNKWVNEWGKWMNYCEQVWMNENKWEWVREWVNEGMACLYKLKGGAGNITNKQWYRIILQDNR